MSLIKQSALSISRIEFANALFKSACRIRVRPSGILNLGLAVSGGVDSMALAALCVRMQKFSKLEEYRENLRSISLSAFIVDHGVRDGSDQEAQNVSNELKSLGISHTEVLTLPTHSGLRTDIPGTSQVPLDFESRARILRYQTLGLACRKHDIQSLLVAHHAEDQAETVLTRLAQGARGRGLAGIKATANIPECEGIHGVHESGDQHLSSQSVMTSMKWRLKELPAEAGGVEIHRPLLAFPKDRLIATCKESNIRWFEDHTNTDPTLTTRNAIRHLYTNHSLPKALSKERILALSEHMQDHVETQDKIVSTFLHQCKLMVLDTYRGILQISFPTIDDQLEDRNIICAMLLRRVLMLVSPSTNITLGSLLLTTVGKIFPLSTVDSATKLNNESTFTVAGVLFSPVHFPPSNKNEKDKKAPTTGSLWGWILMRSPPMYKKDETPLTFLPRPTPRDEFILWDNRFWISLDSRRYVGMRFALCNLTPELLKQLKDAELGERREKWRKERVQNLWGLLDGGNKDVRWRWSVPVLVHVPKLGEGEASLRTSIVGLPTLGYRARGWEGLTWNCRYKKVEWEELLRMPIGLGDKVKSTEIE